MRDAAGELAERFQTLRLTQGRLGNLAPVSFGIKSLRPLERQPDDGEQQQCGRQAEHQIATRHAKPFGLDCRDFGSGESVDRKAGQLTVSEMALDAVDLRARRIYRTIGISGDGTAQATL